VSLFTLLIASTFTMQIQLAYAGGKSPYESGYGHGCDDADLSPSDRYINEPGKGPSYHTDEFMDGYDAGFDDCSDGETDSFEGGDSDSEYCYDDDNDGYCDDDPSICIDDDENDVCDVDEVPTEPDARGGINWIQIYQQLDPVLIPSCSSLVYPNNVLTGEGECAKVCIQNGIALAGGGALLQLPLSVIIHTLQALSEVTGCGGIVEWDYIGSVSSLKEIISIFT
jgi:hypothetical protein